MCFPFHTSTKRSSKIPTMERTGGSPQQSASAPAAGKVMIIIIEKNMLLTEIKVALCSDGIREFKASDSIGNNTESKKHDMINTGMDTKGKENP